MAHPERLKQEEYRVLPALCGSNVRDEPLCSGVEEAISRILYLCCLSTAQAVIIYLERWLPNASSDQPEG